MISHSDLLSLLDYNKDTGHFTWRAGKGRGKSKKEKKAGWTCGSRKQPNYKKWSIEIRGKYYYAHRLAWFYITGKWPKLTIDHKDGNPLNNAFDNLREATRSQQNINKLSKGYSYNKERKKYYVCTRVNRKYIWLGYYDTEEEARTAYVEGCKKYHGEEWVNRKVQPLTK